MSEQVSVMRSGGARVRGIFATLAMAGLIAGFASLPGSAAEQSTVDDLVDRIYVNGTLNQNPTLKAIHDLNERAAFKLVLATWVMENTGGPKVYFGRTMKDAHAPLNISNREFDVILHECKETFYKFAVPEKEMGELMAALEGLRKDVVTKTN